MCTNLRFATALLCIAALSLASAQSVQTATPAPSGPTLQEGTPVKLRISRTISSADAQVGDTVDFEVLEEVKVNNVLIIPKGGTAWATVTAAEPKKRMARGGKLDMNIDSVRLLDGEKVALRAVKEVKGGGHTGAMTGGMVATAIVFFPAAPFFLFMHGKDISIPKGTEITAYINGDVPLDMAKFQSTGQPVQANASPTTVQTGSATLEISSMPSGADIEIDGGYDGNTPSSVGVSPGEHTVKVSKKGYAAWERKIRTSTGDIRIAADLEPATTPAAAPAVSTPLATPAVAQESAVPSKPPADSAAPAAQIKPAVMKSTGIQPAVSAQPAASSAAPAPTPAAAGEGGVSISSDPDGADIFVDSIGRGRAPSILKLPPGKHRIQLVASGYKDFTRDIEVNANSVVNVRGKLEK